MAFCTSCGSELAIDAKFCTNCGAPAPAAAEPTPVVEEPTYTYQEPTVVTATPLVFDEETTGSGSAEMTETDRGLRLAAFIINVVTCVAVCWLIVPLAWMIPMTVRSYNIYRGKKPNTVAFGVCTLIFLDLISGILLLCSKKDQ